MNDYQDIIDLPHYELKYHERMSMEKRAAQFASFDALLGFKEEIKEKGRRTTKEKQLTEEEIELLNYELQELKPKDKVKITIFIPDSKKEGGSYQTIEGYYQKIDPITKELFFTNKKRISLQQILYIQRNS